MTKRKGDGGVNLVFLGVKSNDGDAIFSDGMIADEDMSYRSVEKFYIVVRKKKNRPFLPLIFISAAQPQYCLLSCAIFGNYVQMSKISA